MRRFAFLLVLAAAVPASAQPDARDPKERASELSAAAKQLYAAGDFVGAAHKFEAAYAADQDPAYLFNIAQAFRFGHQCADSAKYFRKFLADVPSAPNADSVREYLKEVDACAEKDNAKPPPPPPPQKIYVPPPETGGGRTKLGIGLAATGLVLIGVGAWFAHDVGVLARGKESLCKGEDPCFWTQDKEDRDNAYDSRALRAQILMGTTLGVGTAAVFAGVGILVFGKKRAEHAPVAVTPVTGGAVAAYGFDF
jgi:hypothetical protein